MARWLVIALLLLTIAGCSVNPFAPRLDTSDRSNVGLGDQKTIDGFFRTFEFAYIAKDTALYSQLLADRFTFLYRDFDNGIDVAWQREIDLVTTLGLFRNTEIIDLRWNSIIFQDGDSLQTQVVRSFRLRVGFRATDLVEITGNANMTLVRPSASDVWKLSRWRDESNF